MNAILISLAFLSSHRRRPPDWRMLMRQPFDHRLSDALLKDTNKMQKIDAAFVVERYATLEFIHFLVNYAVLVSHTKGDVLKMVKADGGEKNIMIYLSASDVAFTLTTYANNKDYWAWFQRDDARKRGNRALAQRRIDLAERQARAGATQSRTRSAASTDVEAEEDEVIPADTPAETTVKKLWPVGNRNKNLKFGMGPEARALYLQLKRAFRSANKAQWDLPWDAWWRSHKDDVFESPRGTPRASSMEDEEPIGDLGQLISYSVDEDEDDGVVPL